jgi:hypothetical protein
MRIKITCYIVKRSERHDKGVIAGGQGIEAKSLKMLVGVRPDFPQFVC